MRQHLLQVTELPAPVIFRHRPADGQELRVIFRLRSSKSFSFIGLNIGPSYTGRNLTKIFLYVAICYRTDGPLTVSGRDDVEAKGFTLTPLVQMLCSMTFLLWGYSRIVIMPV